MAADPQIQQQAAGNTAENFGIEFDKRFTDAVAARMSQAEELTIRILDKPEFRAEVIGALMPRVYERARVAYQKTCPIGELLPRKEDKHLERKSSLRWDLEEGAKSKLVESASIKTVAAFLNSEFGGTLLIGVADDGAIVGLEQDYATLRKQGKDDSDLFLLHLDQLTENAVQVRCRERDDDDPSGGRPRRVPGPRGAFGPSRGGRGDRRGQAGSIRQGEQVLRPAQQRDPRDRQRS